MTDLEKDKILLLAHSIGKMARELQSIKGLLKEIADTPQTDLVEDSPSLVKDLVKAFGEDGTWLERQGVYTLTLAEAKQRAVDIIESVLAKDEPTISKMEQVEQRSCDTCKNRDVEGWKNPCLGCTEFTFYEPKDKPQTDCGDFADRLAYERGVKHAWEVAQKVFNSTVTFYEAEDVAKQIDKDINVRSKDEPQTCSVNGRPYDCGNCEYFRCTADEPQTERSDGAYMCVKENIERKKNMDTTRIKYYIYDIDEHELVAEVYDPYYLGIVVEGFGRNEINMQIQPVVVDTEDCKSDE